MECLGVIGPSRSVIKTCEDSPCSRCTRCAERPLSLIFTALAASADYAGDKKSPRPEEAAKGFKDWNAFEPRKIKRSSAIIKFWTKAAGGEPRA
jgi:hypothetical protein